MQTYVISYKKTYKSQVQYIRDQSSIRWLSAQFSCSVVSNSLRPHGLQHTNLPCSSQIPEAYSNSCPSRWWCHSNIFYCPLLLPPSILHSIRGFSGRQFFTSGGQNTEVSALASVLPINIQDWFPLRLTCWLSLQSRGLSRVFSNSTIQKHQFFDAQLSLQSNSHIHTWLLEKP